MLTIRAKGRGLKNASIRVDVFVDRVHLRIDDVSDPEFWMEVYLPVEALLAAVDRCAIHLPVDSDAIRQRIQAVSQSFAEQIG